MFDIKYPLQSEDVGVFLGPVGGAVAEREKRKAGERDIARARTAERKIANIKASRQRRKSIREARVARASIESGAQASGTSATSSAVSGAGAVGTQLAANLSFLDQTQQLSDASSLFQSKAAEHFSEAADVRAVSNLFKQAASAASGAG